MDMSRLNEEDVAALEKISDHIRNGEPVNLLDAIRAIEYHESLKAMKPKKKWYQFWK